MHENQWPRIAVLGAGAVGCYFGGMLARVGAPVTLIGRAQHVEAINRGGLFLDTMNFQQKVAVSATTEISAVHNAEIALFCVKTLDTEDAARSIASHLAPGAAVISFQNGVDNVERIRAATGIEAFAAVVYVAAEMVGPGHVKHSGRGDLIIGDLSERGQDRDQRQGQLENIAALFARANVPCRVSENVQGELWKKMIMNCAFNAISALSRARYGRIKHNPWTRSILQQAIEEAVAVAGAAGIQLPDSNMVEVGMTLADAMSNATSSTAQDIARGKKTEIDSLNGYLARRGAALGVAAPVNQTLHALVKLLEESI
ncbi:MAG TPA: ketopantoate reductase family protein [Terriglobia bacterium]|nr:ketopantoate reductase family protein [Terriglobia bacterium]